MNPPSAFLHAADPTCSETSRDFQLHQVQKHFPSLTFRASNSIVLGFISNSSSLQPNNSTCWASLKAFTIISPTWNYSVNLFIKWTGSCSRMRSISKPCPLPSPYPPSTTWPVFKWVDLWSLLLKKKIQITTKQKFSFFRPEWSGCCFCLSLFYIFSTS